MLTIEKIEEMRSTLKATWLVLGDADCKSSKLYEGVDVGDAVKRIAEKEKAEAIKNNRLLILGVLFAPALTYTVCYICKVPQLINWGIFGAGLFVGNGYIMRLASKIAHPINARCASVKDTQKKRKQELLRDLSLLEKAIDFEGCKIDNIGAEHNGTVELRVYLKEGEGLDTVFLPVEYTKDCNVGDGLRIKDVNIKEYESAIITELEKIIGELI